MQYTGSQYGGRDYSGQHSYEYYQQPQPIQPQYQNQWYDYYQQQQYQPNQNRGRTQSYEYTQQPIQPIQDRSRRLQSYEGYQQQPQPIQDQYQPLQSYEVYQRRPQPQSFEGYQRPQPTQDQSRAPQSYEGYRRQPQPQSFEGYQQPQPIQDQSRPPQSYEVYGRQPQPVQHQYSGQQQQYMSTPYMSNVPFPQPPPYAAPAVLQQAPPQQQVHRPPRTLTPHPGADVSRRHTRKDPNGVPLTASTSRKRSRSGGAEIRPRMESLARTRTNSSTRADPDHVFMSMDPPNGLELSNLAFEYTVDKLREQILPMWPSGVAHQERDGYDWRVKFVGSPWDSNGPESIRAQRVICRIFWVLSAQGYVYLTSINTGRAFKSPRLVFVRAPADTRAHFFAMSLNKAGNRITFVDPPAAVINSLGLSLRTAFPHRIVNEHTPGDGTFTIELESGIDAMGADKNPFLGHILKYINDLAFKLDASVPLARRGLFGMSGRKEIWVFKGSESWWTSRKR